jgi:hypothetical protein
LPTPPPVGMLLLEEKWKTKYAKRNRRQLKTIENVYFSITRIQNNLKMDNNLI